VAHIRVVRNAGRILAGKPEAKRLRTKHRHGWEDNIKIGFLRNRMGWNGLDLSGRF
jgi:hypothetical protein